MERISVARFKTWNRSWMKRLKRRKEKRGRQVGVLQVTNEMLTWRL